MDGPKRTLDYRAPEPRAERLEPGLGVALGVLSMGCVAVPVAGFVMRSGPLFLCGGAVAPLVGICLAIISLARGADVGFFALVANGMVAIYFIWLVFVNGLC
jgi:hypothetical protein